MIKNTKKNNNILFRINNKAINILDGIVRVFTRNQFCATKNGHTTEGTMRIQYEPESIDLYLGGSRK